MEMKVFICFPKVSENRSLTIDQTVALFYKFIWKVINLNVSQLERTTLQKKVWKVNHFLISYSASNLKPTIRAIYKNMFYKVLKALWNKYVKVL